MLLFPVIRKLIRNKSVLNVFLIFSLLLSFGTGLKHPVYEILKNDTSFMQALEKTIKYFNQRYEDIVK